MNDKVIRYIRTEHAMESVDDRQPGRLEYVLFEDWKLLSERVKVLEEIMTMVNELLEDYNPSSYGPQHGYWKLIARLKQALKKAGKL